MTTSERANMMHESDIGALTLYPDTTSIDSRKPYAEIL